MMRMVRGWISMITRQEPSAAGAALRGAGRRQHRHLWAAPALVRLAVESRNPAILDCRQFACPQAVFDFFLVFILIG